MRPPCSWPPSRPSRDATGTRLLRHTVSAASTYSDGRRLIVPFRSLPRAITLPDQFRSLGEQRQQFGG